MGRQAIKIATRLKQALYRIHQIGFLKAQIGKQHRGQFLTAGIPLAKTLKQTVCQ